MTKLTLGNGIAIFSAGLVSGFVLPPLVTAKAFTIPLGHREIAESRLKVSYPANPQHPIMVLKPMYLWQGRETEIGGLVGPTYPKSVWGYVWDDGINLDLACVLCIGEKSTVYGLEFAMLDAYESGSQLIMELDGQLVSSTFFLGAEPGYRLLMLNK